MNMRLLTLAFLIFTFNTAIAQDLPEITYPSPTASALGEYGNTPISLSMGTPNINIPIWVVKGRKLSVPISLSYRSSGIKVDEHGANVGIGWTLNAGGMITRVVKDKEDNYAIDTYGMFPRRTPWPLGTTYYNWYGTNDELRSELDDAYDGNSDKEPDLFYYNFLGYSGQFIFDDAGNPLVSPNVNFKINSGTPSQVIDESGVIHSFSLYESDSESGYETGRYLTKIESPDLSEWISFEYTPETTIFLVNKREARFVGYNFVTTYLSEPWYKISTNISYRLTKITTSFGETVDFNTGEVRQDLVVPTSLQNKPNTIGSIEIKYDGTCIKKVEFEHEFIESQTPGYIDPNWASAYNQDTDWAEKRLYLKSINETTCTDDEVKTYAFEYYGRTTNNKDLLPSKISFALDHWGYFNGATLNTSYRPPFAGYIPDHTFNPELHYNSISGADRTPSFPEMQYGTLKSITYPTGGQTEYVFEQHQNITAPLLPTQAGGYDSNAGGLRVKEINDKINGAVVKSKKYTYSGGNYTDYPNYGGDDLVYRTEFDINYYEDVLHHFIHPTFIPGSGGATSGDQTTGTDERQGYKIGSGHPNVLGTTNGYHLNYGKVIEEEANNGRIEHFFTTSSTRGDQPNLTIDWAKIGADCACTINNSGSYTANAFQWPYSVRTSQSWMRALPTNKFYYSNTNELVKRIDYSYEYRDLKGVKRKFRLNSSNEIENYLDYTNPSPMYGVKMVKTSFDDDASSPSGACGICIDSDEQTWYYNTYKIGIGVALVSKETIIENGITTVKDYTYNDQNQLATTIYINSKGETLITENKYPQDFAVSNNVYSEMVDANVLSPVIEQETKEGTNTLSILKNNFYDWGTNLFAPEIIQTSKSTNTLDDRIQYHSYYSNGSVQEVSKSDGTHIYYIWGYNEQYPIAKLENFKSSQITTTVQNLIDAAVTASNNDDSITNENILRTALTNLRNTSALENSMVTTYTFDPVIGVTSVTDPKGYSMYYEYDDFNRLKQIKDNDGKILSHNEYHYDSQSN